MTLKPPTGSDSEFSELTDSGILDFLVPAPTGVAATDTTAIQAKLDEANTAGGGLVLLHYGTYVVNVSLVLYSNVTLRGQGRGATIIFLANTTNVDIIKSYQFDSLVGGGTTGGTRMSGITELTLDGNKTNNLVSGRGYSIYGRDFVIENVKVQNTRGLGAYTEWASSGADMEGSCSEIKFVSCTGGGWQFKGPHDMKLRAIKVESCAGNSIEISGNGFGSHWTDCHVWGVLHTIGVDMQTEAIFQNSQAEGVQAGPQVRMLGSRCKWDGKVFGGSAASGNPAQHGVQVGLTAPLTTPGNWRITSTAHNLTGYWIDFQSDAGGGSAEMVGAIGTGLFTGTPNVGANLDFNTGSSSTSYMERRNIRGPGATVLSADKGLTVTGGDTITKRDAEGVKFQSAAAAAVASIHTTNGIQSHNNLNITCYTDNGTTPAIRMRGTDGSIRMGSAVDRGIYSGTGSPETVVTANKGSLFLRTDGGAGTMLYAKESGTGNTGWIAK